MIAFAASQPSRARFLMGESMAGGHQALDARDRAVAEVAAAVDTAGAGADGGQAAPDISSELLVGVIYRLLFSRLRRGEPTISQLLEPVLDRVDSYAVPRGARRWQSAERAVSRPLRTPAKAQLRAPRALGRGRPQLSGEEVAQAQRLRIMFAAATLAKEKGYAESTVSDIIELARVDRNAFYNRFSDKQDAFMAVHEFGVQELMAATAGAFFGGSSWPERVWAAGEAFTQFVEANPTITHVGFVEAYSVGPRAAQRVEDSQPTFAIIAFLALAPFTGVGEANAFIDERVELESAPTGGVAAQSD